jgi:hypothetical protein
MYLRRYPISGSIISVPSKVLSYNVVVSIQEDTFVLKVRCTFVVSYESTSDPYTYFRMISYESTFVRRYEIKYFRTFGRYEIKYFRTFGRYEIKYFRTFVRKYESTKVLSKYKVRK